MKILLINGSPRSDGNCNDALDIIEKEVLKHEKEAIITKLSLGDKVLLGCSQCDDCKTNGGNCTKDDDTCDIINKVYMADMVIISSPVYWWNVTGQLKTLIDKFYSKEDEFNEITKIIGYLTIGSADQDDDQYHFIKKQLQYFADGFDWDIAFNRSYTADAKGDLLKNKDVIEDIIGVVKRTFTK